MLHTEQHQLRIRTKTLVTVILVGAVVGALAITIQNPQLFKGQIFNQDDDEVITEELQDKLKHNRQETISLARDDLQEYMQKMSPEYIQAQRLKILESIRKIFEHIFFVEKNVDNIAEVLLLLDTLARRKNFPRIWLINLAKELINNPKLSPVLKNLLI